VWEDVFGLGRRSPVRREVAGDVSDGAHIHDTVLTSMTQHGYCFDWLPQVSMNMN
jgi:hypothetical protein